MSGITEVNSFPPHYRCPNPDCKYTTFDVPPGFGCGAALLGNFCNGGGFHFFQLHPFFLCGQQGGDEEQGDEQALNHAEGETSAPV